MVGISGGKFLTWLPSLKSLWFLLKCSSKANSNEMGKKRAQCLSISLNPLQFFSEKTFIYSENPNYRWVSQVAQLIKNPLAMQETPVQFLGWEILLEKG